MAEGAIRKPQVLDLGFSCFADWVLAAFAQGRLEVLRHKLASLIIVGEDRGRFAQRAACEHTVDDARRQPAL
ncbi:MAG: hypothetical protein ACI9VR_002363 [Cognaticolwellia sp.]|jgi:hypothetical protein